MNFKTIRNYKILFIIVVLLQLLFCMYMGHQKRSFFCDEIYSYGLANSEHYTFLDNESSKMYGADTNGWVDSNYFKDYVEVNSTDSFSFSAAIQNQIRDVHPPLYYMLLHIVCAFFPDTFTKWTGIGLNLFLTVLVDILLCYIAQTVFRGDKIKSLMVLWLWAFSAAAVSNILFIRMYLLQTVEILAYIAVHIYIVKENYKPILKGFLLIMTVIIGGLTHYYFYVFAFCFSAPICLILLFKKKIRDFLKYSTLLLSGFLINLFLFPATLKHVFSGYRGTEVANNLQVRTENVFVESYLKWINNSIFGGFLKVFVLVAIGILIYKIYSVYFTMQIRKLSEKIRISIKKCEKEFEYEVTVDSYSIIYILMTIATVGFIYVATIGSNLVSNRYIYPAYPIISVWIISCLFCITKKKIIIWCISTLMCVCSFVKYGVDFQYNDYDEITQNGKMVQGDDCLLYYGPDWLDIYTALPLKFQYDETYFFNSDDIENLNEILNARSSYDDVVVCLPDKMSNQDATDILNKIISNTEYTNYQSMYHFYTQAYLLE